MSTLCFKLVLGVKKKKIYTDEIKSSIFLEESEKLRKERKRQVIIYEFLITENLQLPPVAIARELIARCQINENYKYISN